MERLTNDLSTQIVFDSDCDDGAILRVTGEIDMATGPVLVGAFRNLRDLGVTEVIIDASRVTFMDSTGLHALIEGKRLIHDHGMTLALVASPQMRRVLELVFPEPLFAARVDTLEHAREVLGWTMAIA